MDDFLDQLTLYWSKDNRPMIVARIYFKPEHAPMFIEQRGGSIQDVIEQRFESEEALVDVLKEFEPYIRDVVTVLNGKMLVLSAF